MLLKSVEYYNFRPFAGVQKINLEVDSADPEKNVTVILGDNTHGKSTFVLSFIWCLYGESRFSRPNDILNKKIESRLAEGEVDKAYVKVEFEDDNRVYTMKRTQKFQMFSNGKLKAEDSYAELTYVENNETRSVGTQQADINLAIKSILPLDLSSFFFFEGEKNNEISKKDLSKSVRTLIGLEAYDNMRKHLHGSLTQSSPTSASVMGQYLEKQNDECNLAARKEFEKKKEFEAELEDVEERIREIEGNIEFYNQEIEKINQKLREAGPSKEIQARRDVIQKEIEGLKETEFKKSKMFLKKFSDDCLSLFLSPTFRKTNNRLVEMDINDKGIKGIEASAIHELLCRGVCLCGTDLKEGSLAYKNVEKYIDYVPPKSIGVLVRDMQEKIDEYSGENSIFIEEIESIHNDIVECRTKIDELEREDKAKLQQLEEIGVINTEDAEQNLFSYKKMLGDLAEEAKQLTGKRGGLLSSIETATNNFKMYQNKSEKAKKYQLYYRYAEAIYNWVQENYEIKENTIREKLNHYISELFGNMYSGKRDIRIDEKYNIKLTYNGDVVDDTGGLRVIQYFSYVGALVKTAYEVMLEREQDKDGNEEKLGEQYPLVLDAAFSHADATHTKNIATELAKATNQLIFAVMEKDWVHAKEGLVGHVARVYELYKISETEVKIREV